MGKDDDKSNEMGLPLRSVYDKMPLSPEVMLPMFNIVTTTLGLVLASVVYYMNSTAYSTKVEMLAKHDLGWIYLGMVIIKTGSFVLVIILALERKAARINPPDQHVYKVYTKPGASPMPYVLMEEEGVLGRFNRAQRAYQNFLEAAPFLVGYFLLSGFVFPFPTLCIGTIFVVARIVMAVGYVSSPDERVFGNLIGMLTMAALEGFVLLAGLKGLSIF